MNLFLHHSYPVTALSLTRSVVITSVSPQFPPFPPYISSTTQRSISCQTFSSYKFSQAVPPLSYCSSRPTICPRVYSESTSVRLPSTPSPKNPNDKDHSANKQNFVLIPDPPTNCCMNSCANCVWITYAQELAAIYKDGGQAAEQVMKAIEDPSLKIFLSFELKGALQESDDHL